jgi:hypothetical protein
MTQKVKQHKYLFETKKGWGLSNPYPSPLIHKENKHRITNPKL